MKRPTDIPAKPPINAEEAGQARTTPCVTMQIRWWWPLLTLHSECGGLDIALPATAFREDRPA